MLHHKSDILTLSDDSTLRDLIGQENPNKRNNFIVVRDPVTGKILQTRKNLVVRKGREFNLRKMFNIPYPTENQTQLNNRVINVFGIGSGGTPIADPFNPIAPTPADVGLSKEVAFRTMPNGTPLPAGDVAKYTDSRSAGSTSFYKKAFTNKNIIMDDANDDYYVKLTLDITEKDARGALVSELGLYSSQYDSGVYSNFLLATRVTFQTEPLAIDTNKGLVIEYYVYA